MPALADLTLPQVGIRVERRVLEEVCRATLVTCQRLGVVRDDRMSEGKYRAGRFELLSALAYPHADLHALTLCNDFLTYLFYVDDQAEEDESYGKRPELLRRYFEGHLRALRTGHAVAPEDAAGRLLLYIRERALARASQAWLARFANDVEDYLLRGTLGGAHHWTAGTVPAFSEYVAQRAWDSAVMCTQDLLEIAGAGELPGELLARAPFRELRRLCTNVVAFTNDLVSYPKEVQRHRSPNNLVHVISTHERRPFANALERVIELVNKDVAAFEQVAARLSVRDPDTELRLHRYLAGQRAWMSGNLLWSLATGRYADEQSPFPELRPDAAPFGASALRQLGA